MHSGKNRYSQCTSGWQQARRENKEKVSPLQPRLRWADDSRDRISATAAILVNSPCCEGVKNIY